MVVETHRGLRLEVTSRPMSGQLVPGRPPRKVLRYLLSLPAATLVLLLVAPMLRTLSWAFHEDGSWTLRHLLGVLSDTSTQRALLHTLAWVGVAAGLVVVAFGLALASLRFERWWPAFMGALVLPFGVSALASGAAFRLLFDPTPERGTVSALVATVFGASPVWLGPGLIWLVLMSAFAWTWLGFAVSLFRAALRAIPEDVERVGQVHGAGRLLLLRTRVRLVLPVGALILLTLVVAAARLFDLALIATPGPMRQEVDTAAVHWWRLTAQSPDPGRPAALAVVLFCLLGACALFFSHAMGMRRRMPRTPRPWWRERRRDRVRWWNVALGVGLAVLWVFPVLVLVTTALRTPEDAGASGWWNVGQSGLSLASLRQIADAGFLGSLWSTLVVAVGATGLLMVVALLATPALSLRLPEWVSRLLVALLTVLAVAPVQMYAVPLRDAFTSLGVVGSRLPLIVVHVAAGLPLAVLVLRAALVSSHHPALDDALLGQTSPLTALRRLWDRAGAALVAVAVLEFVQVWNDFIISLFVSGPGASPLTIVLWGEARQFATSAGTIAASAALSALVPVVVLLLVWRRWMVPGLTGGLLR